MNQLKLKIEQPIKNLELPREHIVMRLVRAMITLLFGSRGSFKTTRAIPLYMIDMVYEMPRSSGGIIGLSYEHMGDNTIPPLLQALKEMGFNEDEHWVYGKRPPESWPKPYNGVLNGKYDHVMSWHNGTAVHIISLKKVASANGLSLQWGIFDEIKFMSQKQLEEQIFPIFRGNEDHFLFCCGYLSRLMCTDKEADPVQLKWLIDYKKMVDKDLVEIVLTYAMELNDLKLEYYHEDTTKTRQKQLLSQIVNLETELISLRSELIYVAEINADDMRPLLGDHWYNDKKRSSSPRVWKVSYLNEDPETAGDTFYPDFKEDTHGYWDGELGDYNPNKPLIIAPDYQHSVAPITIAQLSSDTLYYIDEVYTLANPNPQEILPNGNGSQGELDEALELFGHRYQGHKNRLVYYVYNSQAKGKQVNADKFYERVVKKLKKHHFRVVKVFIGKQVEHYSKYADTIDWLKHSDPTLPKIKVNRTKCPSMIQSIKGAPAKTSQGKTVKDKSFEDTGKYPNLDQSKTTHFSDCFDDVNQAVFKQKRIKTITGSNTIGFARN